MTLEALNLHLAMVSDLAEAEDRLESMLTVLSAQNLDGMPRGSGVGRRVEQSALQISEQREDVARMQRAVDRSEPAIREWIESIPDNRLRRIFGLRFLAGYEWRDVALIIGGRNTEDAVKSACYRYLSGKGGKP